MAVAKTDCQIFQHTIPGLIVFSRIPRDIIRNSNFKLLTFITINLMTRRYSYNTENTGIAKSCTHASVCIKVSEIMVFAIAARRYFQRSSCMQLLVQNSKS